MTTLKLTWAQMNTLIGALEVAEDDITTSFPEDDLPPEQQELLDDLESLRKVVDKAYRAETLTGADTDQA